MKRDALISMCASLMRRFQQHACRFRACRKTFEIVAGGMDHLPGSESPPPVWPPMPSATTASATPTAFGMRQDRHAVLLFAAITLMLGDTGVN
jgi:hypothetical protein